jgi:thiamine-phosphate pyrophosphorylase
MSGIPTPCVCVITDRRQLSPDARTTRDEIDALERWLDEAIDRVDLIQLRETDLDARTLCALASRLAARTRNSGTAVIVNDRADVARAAGAAGVHLRGDGAPTARVRTIAAAGWLIGRSVHGVAEARAARAADYVIFGTVFPTRSKPGAPVHGLEDLAAAVRAADVPVLAIGGIDPERAGACRKVGAVGVAAIGLFLPPGRAPQAMGIGPATDAVRAAMQAS